MILSTHAIVGGALASLFPSHPVAAFAAGFASHFAIDAIPHCDYPLRSISLGLGARNKILLNPALFRDLALIGFDALAGLAIAIGIFATPMTLVAIVAGVLGGMLPDPLQFVHTLYPHEPLASLQRFHLWCHTKRHLDWRIGISSQIAFVTAMVGAAFGIKYWPSLSLGGLI
jgi:hypothetical protein